METMDPIDNLYYAVGLVAYAIAMADGKVQPEERRAFEAILQKELSHDPARGSVAKAIFQIMQKDAMSLNDSYDWAIRQLKLNSHYLSPELKSVFRGVIEKIAAAYPPVTEQEKTLIKRFLEDISGLHGDPVYYDPK